MIRGVEGESVEDLMKVRLALRLSPDDLRVRRMAARVHQDLNVVVGNTYWRGVVDHPRANASDFEGYLMFLLSKGIGREFSSLVPRLQSLPSSADREMTLAKFAMFEGRWLDALSLMNNMEKEWPGHPESAYLRAQCLLKVGGAGTQSEAGRLLEELALQNPEWSRRAVDLLLGHRLLDEASLKKLLRGFKDRSGSVDVDLIIYELQMAVGESTGDQVLAAVLKDYESAEAQVKTELGRWLNRQRAPATTAQLITEEDAMKNRALFLIRADALASQRKWDQLRVIFQRQDIPLEVEIAELFRFRIAKELGIEDEARMAWARAMERADNKAPVLWFVASYVERLGMEDRVIEVLQQLARITEQKRSAYLAMVWWFDQRSNTAKLLEILDMMRREYPHDPTVANDWAYCSLLLDQNIAEAGDVAARLMAKHPQMLAYRVTSALYYLKTEKYTESIEHFAPLRGGGTAGWRPGWVAVYLAVLRSSGQHNEASAVSDGLDLSKLKEEEKRLALQSKVKKVQKIK